MGPRNARTRSPRESRVQARVARGCRRRPGTKNRARVLMVLGSKTAVKYKESVSIMILIFSFALRLLRPVHTGTSHLCSLSSAREYVCLSLMYRLGSWHVVLFACAAMRAKLVRYHTAGSPCTVYDLNEVRCCCRSSPAAIHHIYPSKCGLSACHTNQAGQYMRIKNGTDQKNRMGIVISRKPGRLLVVDACSKLKAMDFVDC